MAGSTGNPIEIGQSEQVKIALQSQHWVTFWTMVEFPQHNLLDFPLLVCFYFHGSWV